MGLLSPYVRRVRDYCTDQDARCVHEAHGNDHAHHLEDTHQLPVVQALHIPVHIPDAALTDRRNCVEAGALVRLYAFADAVDGEVHIVDVAAQNSVDIHLGYLKARLEDYNMIHFHLSFVGEDLPGKAVLVAVRREGSDMVHSNAGGDIVLHAQLGLDYIDKMEADSLDERDCLVVEGDIHETVKDIPVVDGLVGPEKNNLGIEVDIPQTVLDTPENLHFAESSRNSHCNLHSQMTRTIDR